MPIKNPVYKTVLFQSVAPYINSIAPIQLAYEMAKASTMSIVDFESNTVDGAMVWVSTPQGNNFWEKIQEEHSGNLRAKRRVTVLDEASMI